MRIIQAWVGRLGGLMLALAVVAGAGAQETKNPSEKKPNAAQRKIADAISKGHAYEKHVVDEKLFPEVKSRAEFSDLIAWTLANAKYSKELSNDREAFYDQASNTIIIVNPHARDRGTCFRPSGRKRYYDNLK